MGSAALTACLLMRQPGPPWPLATIAFTLPVQPQHPLHGLSSIRKDQEAVVRYYLWGGEVTLLGHGGETPDPGTAGAASTLTPPLPRRGGRDNRTVPPPLLPTPWQDECPKRPSDVSIPTQPSTTPLRPQDSFM